MVLAAAEGGSASAAHESSIFSKKILAHLYVVLASRPFASLRINSGGIASAKFAKGKKDLTMTYPNVFHLISDVTKKAAVSCVLIGGFAVNYYKVTRQTADVDFLITEKDCKKISAALEKTGYQEDFSQKMFSRFKGADKAYLMDIDFMFVDKQTLEKIIENGKKINIAGQDFIVPSLKNLIALKLHALKYNFKLRENKDLPDIVNLIRINKLNIETEEFQEMCLKYGNEEIYQKIKERL